MKLIVELVQLDETRLFLASAFVDDFNTDSLDLGEFIGIARDTFGIPSMLQDTSYHDTVNLHKSRERISVQIVQLK